MKKKKLMLLSDSAFTTTGYATMTRNILNRLKPNYECYNLAHNYVGQDVLPTIKFKDNSIIDFTIVGQGRVRYCLDIISNEIKTKSIDIFGILLDTFMLMENHGAGNFLNVDTSPAKTFFYFPSDGGGGLPLTCENILKKVNMPISMSKHGKLQVEKMYNIPCEYIPHAVDKKVFYKEDKQKAKQKFNLQDKFVVGIMARNQGRKCLDRSIKAFTIFCKNKPDAFLLIHADPNDAAQAFDLNSLIKSYGIENRVGYTGTTFFKPFTYNQMRDVYNCFDILLHSSSGEGFGLCCHPDTNVITDSGIKKINNVNLKDSVLTHTGHFNGVEKTLKRKFKGNLVCINAYGTNKTIKVTEEHPVYAIKRPKKYKCLGKEILKSKPKWIKAKYLNKGDLVIFPKTKNYYGLTYYDNVDYSSTINYNDSEVWYSYGYSRNNKKFSYKTLSKKLNETKKVIENARKCFKTKSLPRTSRVLRVYNYLKNNDYNVIEPNKYPRFINLDEDLAYVMGWYIAEGSVGNGCIEFSLNNKKTKEATEINRIIKEKFNCDGHKIFCKDKKVLRLIFSGKVLENFFTKLCGRGALNKKIPIEILYNENNKLIEKLIYGLFSGDGHSNKSGWTLTTVSEQLCNDTLIALLKMNINPSISRYINDYNNPSFNIGFRITRKQGISHSNKSWFTKNNLYMLIKNISKEKYDGLVYNLQVKKDNSYVTDGFCLHNCLIESQACGVPIVGTDYTTSRELIIENGQSGELVRLSDEKVSSPHPHCTEVLSGTTTGSWNVERGFMSVYDCVDKLNKLYNDRKLIKKYGKNGINKINKFYTWEKVMPMWTKCLKKLEEM